jgi:transposase
LYFEEIFMEVTVHTRPLGHLGLISAVMKDLGVMEKVDFRLGLLPSESVSYGQRVGSMILNGLGFTNKPLYLTPHFFRDRPVDLLVGENVTADQLNDDALGRCLDKIAAYGTTKLFSEIAIEIATEQKLISRYIHLDSTSISLYGDYDSVDSTGETPHDYPLPCHGFSKDNRPDLKQVVLQMAMMGESQLPMWMEALDGNSSDKTTFPETVKRMSSFYSALKEAPDFCYVADSALYSEGGLKELDVPWITRVPETSNESKSLCNRKDPIWEKGEDSRYQWMEFSPDNPKERWLLVRSEPAFLREKETWLRQCQKRFEALDNALWHLGNKRFSCRNDAEIECKKTIKPYGRIYEVTYSIIESFTYESKGRPTKNATPKGKEYRIESTISTLIAPFREALACLGRFIIATNITDKKDMKSAELLENYKNQYVPEKGFRFLKNDAIKLDGIYLKNPQRIGALMMVMTLCLMIYNFAQQRLHKQLKENEDYLPNQQEKPTQTPSLFWVFSLLSSIAQISLTQPEKSITTISNLLPIHQKIITYFGQHARKIYAIPESILSPQSIKLNQKRWFAAGSV